MVLPWFHPFPVGPRPPSAAPSLFPFTPSFSRSCGLPVLPVQKPASHLSFVSEFIERRVFLRRAKNEIGSVSAETVPGFRPRWSTRGVPAEWISSRIAAGDVLIGIHRNDILAENIVTSTPGSAVPLKAKSLGNALRCTLGTNRGEKLEYVPEYYQIRGDVKCIDKKTCSLCINKAVTIVMRICGKRMTYETES